jgi:hypothetical protein
LDSFVFFRLFWGEIDLAKAPKKCPVADKKIQKLPPKASPPAAARPLFWPKMGCIRPFFRPHRSSNPPVKGLWALLLKRKQTLPKINRRAL